MKEAFIEINGVPTKVTTWGRWIEETDPNDSKDIVIVIPGDPGVNGFYNQFAEIIHNNLGYTVWVVGHAGHNLPQKCVSPIPKMDKHKYLYGLKGQIEHKIAFFDKYVPKDARIHIVGHSIGCYITLDLLQHPNIKNCVKKAYLLFPAFENMAVTANGKFLCKYVKPIVGLILFISFIFTVLPGFVQTVLLYIYMFIVEIKDKEFHKNNIKELVKPGVLRRVFFMAFEEMDLVKERNDRSIQENINKIKFYYGSNDGWVPLTYCEKLKRDYPNLDYIIADVNHTFMFGQSTTVGTTVSEWMKEQ